jgi:hypothetical protein
VPTFLWYQDEYTGSDAQTPPYPMSSFHNPGNGHQLHTLIQSLGGESEFHHPGTLPRTEYAETLWNWLQGQWAR